MTLKNRRIRNIETVEENSMWFESKRVGGGGHGVEAGSETWIGNLGRDQKLAKKLDRKLG